MTTLKEKKQHHASIQSENRDQDQDQYSGSGIKDQNSGSRSVIRRGIHIKDSGSGS